MKTYQIVITKHAVYEIQALDESEAQEMIWDRVFELDFSEPLIAEVLEVDQLPLEV